MRSLEEFTPYTSYRVHWFPYEITRCTGLQRSTVSTRALYGNDKLRPPFPSLSAAATSTQGIDLEDLDPGVWGATVIRTCSVCDQHIEGAHLRQAWISLRTSGADVLPLLVNACSTTCIEALPVPTEGYVQMPHSGGPSVEQPPARRQPR